MTSAHLYSVRTEDSGAKVDRPARDIGDGRTKARGRFAAQAGDYIRRHPIAAVAIAFGVGVLLQTASTAAAQRTAQGTGTRKRRAPQKAPQRDPAPEPASVRRRTHGFGAAEMEFITHHPDGKKVEFKFAWKKRPIDAPETDWPTDQMGFTADRPNGKHTAFTFTGKTRPVPAEDEKSAAGDYRPGLGRATMEFKSSRPGRRDFRFTWNRVPPESEA